MGRNRKNKTTPEEKPGEIQNYEKDQFLEMKISNVFGRYLIAKENIKPGTLLLKVSPLVVGPTQSMNKIYCLECYKELTDTDNCKRCNGCGWPLCSSSCQRNNTEHGHSEIECNILRKSKKWPNTLADSYLYNIILPLRVTSLKFACAEKWSEVQKMQSHTKLRKKNKSLWNTNQAMIDCLRKECGIIDFTEQELHTVCGYLQVNSFAIEHTDLSGLYPTAFLFAHNCVPNTTHIIDTNMVMTVRATTEIFAGDAVTLSYANTLKGTLQRRAFLKQTKYFNCNCKRCTDPTELGTYISAIKCESCKSGYLIPLDSLERTSSWICSCGCEKNVNSVEKLTKSISEEMESVKNPSIDEMENFLKLCSTKLHPNHFLLIEIKCLLSQLYGKSENYLLQDLSQELLQRKIDICNNLLGIMDTIEPGLSRIRGITLYELHAPLMLITLFKYREHKISERLLKIQLKQIKNMLIESSLILSFEDPLSKQGQIGVVAKQALQEAKQW